MREAKSIEAAVIAVVVGLLALFGLGMLPSWLAPYSQQLSQLNVQLTAVLFITLFGIGMAILWPRIRILLQTVLVVVLLSLGIGLAIPAFLAIAFIGLVLTMLLVTRVVGWRRGMSP